MKHCGLLIGPINLDSWSCFFFSDKGS